MSNITDNPKIQVLKAGCSGVFTNYIYKAIPLAFDESMSYYETLAGLRAYLKDVILPTVNGNAEAVAELQELYIQLNDYVTNYFDNLDVQEEINNKLDQMVEDGTLENILLNYTQITKVFDTYSDMMLDTSSFVNGMKLKTLGYHFINDGGGAEYIVTNVQNNNKYQISIGTNLWVELIINDNTLHIKQLGAYGDDVNDDTQVFETAIEFIKNKYMTLHINSGVYLISSELVVDWQNPNFNSNFGGSYGIKGDGIFNTKLDFTTPNGLLINPNNNMLSIEIADFCIENKNYNILEQTGNQRLPDNSQGKGLLLKHIGYTGHISRIGVRGFYIGIASRNCYGGPIFDNIQVNNCIFGFSSKDDTTIEFNSCSFRGIEACYCQEGGTSTLKNVIAEGTFRYFTTNEYNQRSKFEGRGFVFINSNVNMFGCYTEHLYGNCRYIENSKIIELNGVYNNFMNSRLAEEEYAELKQWLIDNPGHNWDDFYIDFTNIYDSFVKVSGGYFATNSTANVNVGEINNRYEYSDTVLFEGLRIIGSTETNYNRFYKGTTKPIVKLACDRYTNKQNHNMIPLITRGIPHFLNDMNPDNFQGYDSINLSRKSSSFTDSSYNETSLYVRNCLDGSIRMYRKTLLNGTDVDTKEVIRIASDGKVTFPQN